MNSRAANFFRIAHLAGAIAVLAFSTWLIVLLALEEHAPRSALEHLGVGLLCGAFASAQLVALRRRRLSAWTGGLFYLLCPLLAMAAMQALSGYIKGWAPATPAEAFDANVKWFGALAIVVAACALSMLPSWRDPARQLRIH
jgi:hypothetical protein